ncbi:hypothetical protein G7054_g11598 [Neopestalotiopsis clavispora]|nr:hypothetical protein G7054_g11598 [Neopestalotiopsis clavispora]
MSSASSESRPIRKLSQSVDMLFKLRLDNEELQKLANFWKGNRLQTMAELESEPDWFGNFPREALYYTYNDATIEYLRYVDQWWKGELHQGGSSRWLEGLKKGRSLHLQLVQVSIRFMNNKFDPDSRLIDPFSIDKLVRELYSFKHFEVMTRRSIARPLRPMKRQMASAFFVLVLCQIAHRHVAVTTIYVF